MRRAKYGMLKGETAEAYRARGEKEGWLRPLVGESTGHGSAVGSSREADVARARKEWIANYEAAEFEKKSLAPAKAEFAKAHREMAALLDFQRRRCLAFGYEDIGLTVPAVTGTSKHANPDAAFKAFEQSRPDIEVYDTGLKFLFDYIVGNPELRAVICHEGMFALAFDRLRDLGIVVEGEHFMEQKISAPKPKIKPTTEQLIDKAGSAREISGILGTAAAAEVRPMYSKFVQYLRETFAFEVNDSQCKFLFNLFDRMNLNPLLSQSWDAARVHAVKKGVLPAECETTEERIGHEVDEWADNNPHGRPTIRAYSQEMDKRLSAHASSGKRVLHTFANWVQW